MKTVSQQLIISGMTRNIIRVVLLRRTLVIHTLLFLGSYALFLAYFQYTQPSQGRVPATTRIQQSVQRMSAGLLAASTPLRASVKKEPTLAEPNRATVVSVSPMVDAEPMAATDMFVPDYSSPQSHFNSLERAAHFDDHAQNRLAAVASLRQLAAAGDTRGEIMEALRGATMDEDPAVRNAAQSAYEEVQAMQARR